MNSDRQPSVLLDENVDRQVIEYLGAEGYEGVHVVDVLEPGAADTTDILPYASEYGHCIVTKDTDFLVVDDDRHAGILFVADHQLSAYEIATGILRIFDAVPDSAHLQTVFFLDPWL